jgi:L-asparagine transporter-like permease
MAETGVEQRGRGGQEGHLQQGLKRRHMTMISLGGIIGAGLFVGTGPILNQAGPATILTYLLTGCILILIMRMLGEMAVAQPSIGSFSDFSRMALGNWAGFSIGWLYWYFWAIVVGFEATVAAGILGQYVTSIAPWLISLILILLLTATNLYSVRSYGEFEFWFAGIKVAAIIIFIVLGALFVIGLWPGGGMGLSNLYDEGGFFPNGAVAMFSGIVTVIFAFVGAEIVTIAAAESNEPEEGVARATNAVIYRVLLFYVVAVFFVACIVPWNTPFTEDVIKSPFTLCPQLQPLHDLPHALRPHPSQRRTPVFPQHHRPRRANLGDPRGDQHRIRLRRDLLLRPGVGVHVADQRLGCRRDLRLPSDRRLGARDASPH